jgi:hypothetical protein
MWTFVVPFKEPPLFSSRKYNTVLYKNSFERGSAPRQNSIGFMSLQPRNTWVTIESIWVGFQSGNRGPPSRAAR